MVMNRSACPFPAGSQGEPLGVLVHGQQVSWRNCLKERSDDELMMAYQRGDLSAFETLLKRYEKGIYHFSFRLLDNPMQAEDVTQEAFVRVIKASSRYRASTSFRNYLYRIARNLCLDILRKKRTSEGHRETENGSGPAEILEAVPDRRPGPESLADARQVRTALRQALNNLPPEQREVFLLKEVRDMKLQDVATVTGANLNTVKSRLRYALLNLREQLSPEWAGKEAGDGL